METAIYWADKLVSLGQDDPEDVYTLGQCLISTKQYHREANIVTRNNLNLHMSHVGCCYVAAKAQGEKLCK